MPTLDGVHSYIQLKQTDDHKVELWIKDKHHQMEPTEAIVLARALLETAGKAIEEQNRRQKVLDDSAR